MTGKADNRSLRSRNTAADRRVSARVSARLKVWCEGEDFTLLADSVNASVEGIFVRSGNPAPLGSCFRAVIHELDVAAYVEVRWVRRSGDAGRAGMGLRIVAFERGAHALQNYLEGLREQRPEWLEAAEQAAVSV